MWVWLVEKRYHAQVLPDLSTPLMLAVDEAVPVVHIAPLQIVLSSIKETKMSEAMHSQVGTTRIRNNRLLLNLELFHKCPVEECEEKRIWIHI
jgi:hypothetical protein